MPLRRSAAYLRSWLRLSLAEKCELALVVVLALLAEVAVKAVSLPRLASALGIGLTRSDTPPRNEPSRRPRPTDWAFVDRRARMVDRVYKHWPRRSSCLRRAVVLGFRVRRAGPTLIFGVAREGSGLRMHAWIEINGTVVGEESGDWAPLSAHGSAG